MHFRDWRCYESSKMTAQICFDRMLSASVLLTNQTVARTPADQFLWWYRRRRSWRGTHVTQ